MKRPLYSIHSNRSLGTALLLLDHGADVDARLGAAFGGITPLMVAAWRGDVRFVECLLDRRADPELAAEGPNGVIFAAQRDTALSIATENEHAGCVQLLRLACGWLDGGSGWGGASSSSVGYHDEWTRPSYEERGEFDGYHDRHGA
jgi:hypothetical protein